MRSINSHFRCIIFCTLFFMFLGAGCTERRGSPVGIDLIDEDKMGEGPLEEIVYAIRDTSFDEILNGGASSQIIVGSEGETIFRSILRFETLPEADSIISATVKLRKSSMYSVSSFDIVAYMLLEDWDEIQVTWEAALNDTAGESVAWGQPGGDFDPVEVGRFSFSDSEEDTLFEMDLDTDLVKGWIDGEVQNNGIILISAEEGSDFSLSSLISRQSTDGVGEPRIEVEFIRDEDSDSTSVIEFFVTNDAFIYDFQGDEPLSSPSLGDVPNLRTMILFDLSGLDSTWTIVRAILNMNISDSTHFHEEVAVEVMAVLDSVWMGSDTETDKTILETVTVSPGDSVIELNLTGIAQLWVTGDFENYGIFLKMGRATDLFGYLELHGVSAPVQSDRPFLRLVYHKPGEPPFVHGTVEERDNLRLMK